MLDCDIDFSGLSVQEIDALSDIASTLKAENKNIANVLKTYETQIQHIHNLVGSNDRQVLAGLLDILLDGLKQLANKDKPITVDECRFLAKVPEILSEYIFIPASKMPDAHLLSHFKNTDWVRPVSEDEEKYFLQELMADPADYESDTLQVIEDQMDASNESENELSDLLT